eukprot:scaffold12966_cov78-Skeletonema_dohrnii-CCMP3373.AAC.1
MERRDFDYYEARARDVKLDDITSCEDNAEILRRLRDQYTSLDAIRITDQYSDNSCFIVGEGDDLGWLGYFIGKSKYLEKLIIYSWGEGENIEAFIEGINRNQSIDSLHICTDLRGVSFRNLRPFFRNNYNRLAQLELNFEVGLECAQSIAFVLDENRCQSLKKITIEGCYISDEGFVGIATALGTYPQLESLSLEYNNIGLMGCIALGDSMRGWGTSNLKHLDLDGNGIDDQGLQALAAGMTNTSLKTLYLSNNLITGAGLRSLSDYFQSESCCLKILNLHQVNFGDEGALALADALIGNKSLTSLCFHPGHAGITDVGWAAFSKLLCDPSSIKSTYHSNHIIKRIGEYEMLSAPLNIRRYVELNKYPHPAMNKILESHPDLDMEPFFRWKLKLLPVVTNWFRSAISRVANDLGESIQRGSLPSRELSALYKFVRGMPAFAVTSYWQQLVMNAQAKRRRIDDVMRRLDDERRRLEDERRRLDGERCKLDDDEEAAWVRLGGRPTTEGEGSGDFVSGSKRRRQE